MIKKKQLAYIIHFVSLIGIIGVGALVLAEIKEAHTCPRLLGVPACYFILLFIVGVWVSHLNVLKDKNILYFIFGGIALFIAIVASYLQFNNLAQCPKFANGFPMCYASLFLFLTLLLLKIKQIRLKV